VKREPPPFPYREREKEERPPHIRVYACFDPFREPLERIRKSARRIPKGTIRFSGTAKAMLDQNL